MNKLTLFICSSLALVVSGCSVTTSYYTEQSGYSEIISNEQVVTPPVVAPVPIPVEMSIEKRAYLETQQAELTKDLEKTGVIINKQGNDLLLYIPVAEAYNYNGFQLTGYGYTVLNKIAINLLDQEFSEFTLGVYDGLSTYHNPNFNIIEARARIATDYLLSRRVNPDKIVYKQESIPVPQLIDPTISYIEIRIKNDVNNYR